MTRVVLNTVSRQFLLAALALAVVAASPVEAQIALVGSTPGQDAKLSGPVRTVRVWFDVAPVMSESTLEITGPGNRATVEGVHTMGENDLMGRVSGPMPDGEWTMRWTAVGPDGESQTGSITFTVDRGR
ncbi:MAG: copper resistance CopC family protein [Acidobacteriota bacterium]|nr:copper resistance CopC family protein [Acidobacteriota bacterium]